MKLIGILLRPLSWVYAIGVTVWNTLHDNGFLVRASISSPVISVGNLTAGGTGKTPMVSYIVGRLEAAGKRAAVVGRGYRRKSKGMVVVSDGERLVASAVDAGDELYLLASRHPRAVVIADEGRMKGAAVAVMKYKADLVVLDDGFQRRSMHRDLDIVMIDASVRMPPMLPAGLRREPLRALRRASMIVVSNATGAGDGGWTGRYTTAPRVCVRYAVAGLRRLNETALRPVAEFAGRSFLAFCGIGNPASFRATAEEAGLDVRRVMAFRDHVWYTRTEQEKVESAFARSGAEFLLTTEKDAAKLAPAGWQELPVYVLAVALEFVSGRDLFERTLQELAAR